MAYNPGTNIVVSGKTFMDVPAVQFKTPNGATVNFAHVGGQIRFSPTLEEQTEDVANYQDVIINPITSTLLNQLDSDFVAENIKNGVDLFGLLGTLEAGGGTISGRKFISGEITFSETPTSEITISHDAPGFISRPFVFSASRSYAPVDNVGALIFACEGSGTYINSSTRVSLLSSISATIDCMGYANDTSFTIKSKSATKMLAGKTYIWFRIEK